uniref:3-oxoacyl-[acyl-carrier-protein] reductase FabG n=1 Tax=Talaromyces marneffei PM1 TaxID=1077442 RepID=A0A093X9K7_TALMA
MSSPIALVLGAGANIGQAVGRKFTANGYKVALASRTASDTSNQETKDGLFHFRVDLSNPTNVKTLFEQVQNSLGVPSVVIYNASHTVRGETPFSITPEAFQETLNVITTSAFAAAQEAVRGFETLPKSSPKSFLFTGNALDEIIIQGMAPAGAGKSATAHLMKAAAASETYLEKGYTGGLPAYNKIDGAAHADHFYELASDKNQREWKQTFVKGKGYVKF